MYIYSPDVYVIDSVIESVQKEPSSSYHALREFIELTCLAATCSKSRETLSKLPNTG